MLKMSFKKLIFHATSSREYKMFLSVSHSVHLSWFFLCQHNFSKTAVQNSKKLCSNDEHNMYICIFAENSNRISGKFLVMKDIQCRCTYSQKLFINFFSHGIMSLLIIEIWPKLNIQLKQFSSATPLNRFTKLFMLLYS